MFQIFHIWLDLGSQGKNANPDWRRQANFIYLYVLSSYQLISRTWFQVREILENSK